MRGVNIFDLEDLSNLAEGLKILTGQGITTGGEGEEDNAWVTKSLWVEIQDFPVRDEDGNRIGVFTFDEESEDFVYVPRKTTKQGKP